MKLHKIHISVFCMIIFSLLMSSCNSFLEEEPENKKSVDQHWKTASDAKSGVNALYFGGVPYLNNTDVDGGWTPKATMWGGVLSGLFVDKRKDRTFTNAAEGSNFNIEAFNSAADKLWNEFYKGSSRSNFVIANIPKMTNVLSEAQIKNYLAQGKFFRAYSYFYLAKEFGSVPYIDFPYISLEGIYQAPTPVAEIYKKVEQDLLDALEGEALPEKAFYDNGCYVTKPMAQTLLAQVYLQWAGAPLNGGNEYYAKAAAMAEKVINGKVHALAQDVYDKNGNMVESAFNVIKTTKSSNEIILAKEYNKTTLDVGNSYYHRAIESDAMQWGAFKATGLYNAYLPCDMLLDSYDVADIRGQEKQFFFWEYTYILKDQVITKKLGNAGNWAWFDEKATTEGRDGDYNMPTMRYAEVLLIAAEGLARTGKEAAAKGYLNEVRNRAGLGDETAAGDALIQSILTERFHEFPLEFKIWDDIRRTRLYPEESGMQSGKLRWVPLGTAKIQNKPEGLTKVGGIPEHALVWPIPLGDMQANPLLEGHQNPGWN